jgi:hypothetical protein
MSQPVPEWERPEWEQPLDVDPSDEPAEPSTDADETLGEWLAKQPPPLAEPDFQPHPIGRIRAGSSALGHRSSHCPVSPPQSTAPSPPLTAHLVISRACDDRQNLADAGL